LRSAIECRRGEKARAVQNLEEAIRGAEACDLPQCAAAARYRLGELVEGTRGAELVEAARAWMQEQQIRKPERMVEVWAPGFG